MIHDPLDSTLKNLNISLHDLKSKIRGDSKEIAVAAGTLIEGIGTPDSDLDVYVFYRETAPAAFKNNHNYSELVDGHLYHFYDYVGRNGYAIDVKYFNVHFIRDLIEGIHAEFDSCLYETKLKREIFGKRLDGRNDHADMAHKLLAAVPIQGEEEWEELLRDFPRERFCYLLYRTGMGGYPEFKDLAGFVKQERWHEAATVARELLYSQMRGYTHLLGNTNYKDKWLIAYLSRVKGFDQGVRDEFYKLYFGDIFHEDAAQSCVLEICKLIDNIWDRCGDICDESKTFIPRTDAEHAILVEYEREPIKDPQTKLEFDLRRRQFGLPGIMLKGFVEGDHDY